MLVQKNLYSADFQRHEFDWLIGIVLCCERVYKRPSYAGIDSNRQWKAALLYIVRCLPREYDGTFREAGPIVVAMRP